MRFLFLLYGDPAGEAALSAAERGAIVAAHRAYRRELAGRLVLGEALEGRASAVVVRPGQTPPLTDGPFAETKEAVGGFYVVQCPSREEALELAARVPPSPGLAVEVLTIAGG